MWTHTRTGCAELERLADLPSLDRAAQLKLLFTALFHDAGKTATRWGPQVTTCASRIVVRRRTRTLTCAARVCC